MELDWLETFLAVVDRGGFTAAAAQVHRSQSRVSAHIAALEREMGIQLIDRAHRPATVTAAGRIFAIHARDILDDIGSARSAIGVLRAIDTESLAVLTMPYIGSALFPGVIAELIGRHPGAQLALSEQGWLDGIGRHPGEGFVLAVLPAVDAPLPPGLLAHLLWREPLQVVVPVDHPLTTTTRLAAPLLADFPIVLSGKSARADQQILVHLAARGLEVSPRVTVDTAQTLVAAVRGGVGIGIATAVALQQVDTSELAVLDFDAPAMFREVFAYWYDVLLTSEVGRTLQETVIKAPLPPGAVAPERADRGPVI